VKNDNSALATNSHNLTGDICRDLRAVGAVGYRDRDLKGGEKYDQKSGGSCCAGYGRCDFRGWLRQQKPDKHKCRRCRHGQRANNSVVNVTKAKGGKQRRVHLDAETITMLSDYVSAQQLPDDRPVFALKQRQVRNIVKRYGSVIGKDVHPHTFRHSYAIHCVRNGWDTRRLQQVLGHSSLNVTAVYLQFNDQDIKELYHKTPF
jgi:integrase